MVSIRHVEMHWVGWFVHLPVHSAAQFLGLRQHAGLREMRAVGSLPTRGVQARNRNSNEQNCSVV